ncbi:MAG: glutathione S-transferase N-terminal domain-containing protein [Gammaproteobacteria bacterium]|nr:glutathione S-transferase N-terminal domain-containing protein [Gammaproteobacteria bacterium]MCW8909818.1 glutathione S-transferase N-terminal domain-containing protein [Gammaproteobacteria bacterium]MCW9056222.1 glutathione S-transferase N-terminal domain-containing protein [Gammaproteobacteria bacterium]
MLLKLLRESLGQLVVIINFITLPRKMKRSTEEQKKVNQQASKMSLYQFKRCPFCVRTRRTIHKLNLPIELRDASRGSAYRDELEAEGGKIKVPCLRIDDNGNTQWLYESAEIIAFLNERFADNTSTELNS